MTIRQLQTQITEVLNGVEDLVKNHCKAIAEDALTVQNSIGQAVTNAGEIALVVVTPRAEIDASGWAGIPVTVKLSVKCIESPALRSRRNGFTALDAAEMVALLLHGESMEFSSIEQTADSRTGTVVATVDFNTSIILAERN